MGNLIDLASKPRIITYSQGMIFVIKLPTDLRAKICFFTDNLPLN